MKVRIITAGLVLTFLASRTFAIIGPPTAGFEPGQLYIGADFFYSVQDLDTIKTTGNRIDYIGSNTYPSSGTTRYKVRDFNINRYYGRLGYGMDENWEVYGQLGLVDIKADYKETGINDFWNSADFDSGFAYGVGTKITFGRQDNVDWGFVFQTDLFAPDGDYKYTTTTEDAGITYTQTARNSLKLDAISMFFAIGPTVDMGGWKLYGGPFFYYLSVGQDFKEKGAWQGSDGSSGTWIKKESGDSATKSLGGYIGAQCDVLRKYRLSVEFLGIQDGWGLAAGIVIPF
jgi:hypothetical protein